MFAPVDRFYAYNPSIFAVIDAASGEYPSVHRHKPNVYSYSIIIRVFFKQLNTPDSLMKMVLLL